MNRLELKTSDEAETRSRDEWEKRLGRKKRPEDVTEFLWSIDGAAVLVPDDDAERLALSERRSLVAFVEKSADLSDEDVPITRVR